MEAPSDKVIYEYDDFVNGAFAPSDRRFRDANGDEVDVKEAIGRTPGAWEVSETGRRRKLNTQDWVLLESDNGLDSGTQTTWGRLFSAMKSLSNINLGRGTPSDSNGSDVSSSPPSIVPTPPPTTTTTATATSTTSTTSSSFNSTLSLVEKRRSWMALSRALLRSNDVDLVSLAEQMDAPSTSASTSSFPFPFVLPSSASTSTTSPSSVLQSSSFLSPVQIADTIRMHTSQRFLEPSAAARLAHPIARLAVCLTDESAVAAFITALQPLLFMAQHPSAECKEKAIDPQSLPPSDPIAVWGSSPLPAPKARIALQESPSMVLHDILVFDDCIFFRNEVLPLEWLWIAHKADKQVARLVTLSWIFAFVADADVIQLLRSVIGKWLENSGAVTVDGLRSLRYRCAEFSYKGTTRAGVFEGKGFLELSNGISYAGFFEQGKRHGKGMQVNRMDGVTYKGYWALDKMDGRGVIHYSQSHPEKAFKFAGHFRQGVRDGLGVLYRNDGSSLRCMWSKDAPVAPVIVHHSNGSLYCGGWHDNRPAGFGVESTPNVGRYYGEWMHGVRSGKGAFQRTSYPAAVLAGVWSNGALTGKGQIELPGVIVINGTFTSVTESTLSDVAMSQGKVSVCKNSPTGHLGRWSLFVKMRFDASMTDATRVSDLTLREGNVVTALGTMVSLELLLAAPAYAYFLDEFVFICSALFDRKINGPSELPISEQDYHLFMQAVVSHMVTRLCPSETVNQALRQPLHENADVALERMLLGTRTHFYKTLFAYCESPSQDLQLDQAFAWFVKQSRAKRASLLADEGSAVYKWLTQSDAEPLEVSSRELQKITTCASPHEKLQCLERWTFTAHEHLPELEGMDDLLPCLIYSMAMACVPALASEHAFIDRFLGERDRSNMRMSGNIAYVWTTFGSCIQFCRGLATSNMPRPKSSSMLNVELPDEPVTISTIGTVWSEEADP